ncbi:MAG: putative alpha/beta hydrolase family esterase [Cryomorphaceae bacterium]|jgi:predicted alpha/beta hydrolase family esterase
MSKFKNKPLTAISDVPDSRDFIYEPSLNQVANDQYPSEKLIILNQGSEGSCTGHGLAATINYLNQKRDVDFQASRRMLYEMAKKNDQWPGEEYEGSSIRAAIKGWRNMGVCSEKSWPYKVKKPEYLTITAAKEARSNTIGAYYRLAPNISHFHSALNEAGILLVSAKVHTGWQDVTGETIEYNSDSKPLGGHAFTIVGYNDKGFWVQNSWGKQWGANGGIALWTYEDWVVNIMDAWVVTLALPTPQIFGKQVLAYRGFSASNHEQAARSGSVDRADIAGHFVHIDDGKFHDRGRYWSNLEDITQTAELVGKSDKYDHIVIYAHGGLNSPKASAKRIKAMKDGFKRNRVYPFHLMYDTGLAEELKDLIFRRGKDSRARVGGFTDWTDKFLERILRGVGTLVWDEMKNDAELAFRSDGAGLTTLKVFINCLRQAAANGKPKKIHIMGHSTGGIIIAHLLRALQNTTVEVHTCSLLAPATTIDLFKSHYLPVINGGKKLSLKQMDIYNLSNHLERDDSVGPYRKSLLYLVSNAFERAGKGTHILGMQKFLKNFDDDVTAMPSIHYSNGHSSRNTQSSSHGGFDNDVSTMNHALKQILGAKPVSPFEARELEY